MAADNVRFLHPDAGDLFGIVNCSEDGHIGVALAAARTADFAEPGQRVKSM